MVSVCAPWPLLPSPAEAFSLSGFLLPLFIHPPSFLCRPDASSAAAGQERRRKCLTTFSRHPTFPDDSAGDSLQRPADSALCRSLLFLSFHPQRYSAVKAILFMMARVYPWKTSESTQGPSQFVVLLARLFGSQWPSLPSLYSIFRTLAADVKPLGA